MVDNRKRIVDPNYIYFIFDGKYFKIGHSKNPKRRVSDLQVGCSERNLFLSALIRLPNKDYAFTLEKELHNILKNHENIHVKGEWYDLLSNEDNREYDLLSSCFRYCTFRAIDGLDLCIDEVFIKYYDDKKRLLDLVEVCLE